MPRNYGMNFVPIEHSTGHVRIFRPPFLSVVQAVVPVGVPQVHHFGQEGLHNVLVIDLLGPNLEDLFDMCGRKFTIKTVCMAAKQMVSALVLLYFRVCARSMSWDRDRPIVPRLSPSLCALFDHVLIIL